MPGLSMVHVDQSLTNVSIQLKNSQLMADQVFPVFPVNNKSDKYYQFDLTAFRPVDDARGMGAEANEMFGWNLSTDFYDCEGHALKQGIPDELRNNADPATDIDVTTTENTTGVLMLNREVALLGPNGIIFGAGSTVPSLTLSGASKWSDYSDSDPIGYIDSQKETVAQGCGQKPNRMLISRPVFRTLRNHPRILDRLKYTENANSLTADDLADAFEVEKVLVHEVLYNSAVEGQEDSLAYLMGNNALLYYAPPSIGKKVVALGALFTWNYGVPQNQGYLTKRWREEKKTRDVIECQLYYGPKVIAPKAGVALLSVI